jgi:dihydrofolate reductase
MRKLILSVAISLDGLIEGPNGEYDWCKADPEYDFRAFFDRVDSIFIGRKTYEMSMALEGGPPGFPKFKEYVFSRTLETVKEGATLVNGDIKQEVEKIKNEEGKDIWLFGGAALTTSLMNLGLVDEVSIVVYPIILGAGKPLFTHLDRRIGLRLLHTKPYPSGMISLSYSVARQDASPA